MKLARIPSGTFQMGSPRTRGFDSESPRHPVMITRPFYLAVHKVTQAQFERVMHRNPSWFSASGRGRRSVGEIDTESFPVEGVTYFDAIEFCNKLSELEDLLPCYALSEVQSKPDGSIEAAHVNKLNDGTGYRLPSEAEWEYCARAGTTTEYSFGDDAAELGDYAWFGDNSGNRTHPVGEKRPNPWKLYDMGGLVREWCEDVAHYSYDGAPKDASVWGDQSRRICRGGSWDSPPWICRCAARAFAPPHDAVEVIGFRVVRVSAPTSEEDARPIRQHPDEPQGDAGVPVPRRPDMPPRDDGQVVPSSPNPFRPSISPHDDRTAPVPQRPDVPPQDERDLYGNRQPEGTRSRPKARASAREKPQSEAKTIRNTIGMELVRISAGRFWMGSSDDDKDAQGHEKPRHQVEISKPFYLGKHEVTVGQFRQFVEDTNYSTDAEKDGDGGGGYDADKKQFLLPVKKYTWRNLGFNQTDDHPVVNVSYSDSVAFCKWLSNKEGQAYRLPTEAEWEYSCRASSDTRFQSGDEASSLEGVANIADKSLKENWDYTNVQNNVARRRITAWFNEVSWTDGYPFTAPVGRFRANGFGLCDMHGNVWEWCSDWYAKDYFENSPLNDPQGPSAGSYRVYRGGSFVNTPSNCRSANRAAAKPFWRDGTIGFRVVLDR